MELTGKTAIITGGGRGIGKSICLKLASLGANCVINYANSACGAESVKEECEAMGVKAITVKADVSNEGESEALFMKALDVFGKIDILVNNAGITRDNLIIRMSAGDFSDVIDINLKGSFLCMKQAAKLMMKNRYGKIINISSVVGLHGNAGQVNYSASKAGIIGMTKSLAKELGSRKINVNAVAPGFISTEMTEVLDNETIDTIKKNIPLGYLGEAQDVAELVAFLAGDKSRYITGQVFSVDGGMGI